MTHKIERNVKLEKKNILFSISKREFTVRTLRVNTRNEKKNDNNSDNCLGTIFLLKLLRI